MYAIARFLQTAGMALICLCAVAASSFLTRADEQPQSQQYTDLQHLQFTASGAMPVRFLFPEDGFASASIATRVVAQTVNGAGVELRVNGDIIPSRNLGRMAIAKTGMTEYDYYGVLLHPGPNTIAVASVGANGLRGTTQTETVFGPGLAAHVKLSLLGSLVADGKTQAYLLIEALDQWDHPAMAGADVRVRVLAGSATIGRAIGAVPAPSPSAPPARAASVSPSSQPQDRYELGEGGRIQIPIAASLQPGTLDVQAVVGEASDTQSFTVAPYLRAPLVNGVVSIGAGSVPAAVDGDGQYDGGGARKERIGIFASGKVGRAAALTVAYESQNPLQQSSSLGPYVQDPDERPYQTYGDSSTVDSDFHSTDRLYARIDNGRNNLMWGQYDAQVGDAQGVGQYQQQLSGLKGEIGIGAPGRGRLSAFTARNPMAFVSFSVPVTGLSSLLQPLHPNVVVGSDMLSLVAINRTTGAVLSQTPLLRNVDYTIDYATGTVRFINVPLPFDAHFNPQLLQVQYQYQGQGARSVTTGFDFRYAIDRARHTTLDVGYMNDATGTSNYTLLTQTLGGALPAGEWVLSHASSNGIVPNTGGLNAVTGSRGSAVAFSLNDRVLGSQIALNYQNTGPGYANPFGGFTVNGLESMTATLGRTFNRNRGNLLVTLGQQRNTGGTAQSLQQTMTASWRTLVSDVLTFTLGLQAQRQVDAPGAISAAAAPAQSVSGSGAQLQIGAQWKPGRRLNVSVQHGASLGEARRCCLRKPLRKFPTTCPSRGRSTCANCSAAPLRASRKPPAHTPRRQWDRARRRLESNVP